MYHKQIACTLANLRTSDRQGRFCVHNTANRKFQIRRGVSSSPHAEVMGCELGHGETHGIGLSAAYATC